MNITMGSFTHKVFYNDNNFMGAMSPHSSSMEVFLQDDIPPHSSLTQVFFGGISPHRPERVKLKKILKLKFLFLGPARIPIFARFLFLGRKKLIFFGAGPEFQLLQDFYFWGQKTIFFWGRPRIPTFAKFLFLGTKKLIFFGAGPGPGPLRLSSLSMKDLLTQEEQPQDTCRQMKKIYTQRMY